MTLAHLCLGTASWATDQPYNDRTPPSDADLVRLLDVAYARGIRWLDTAIAYGNVEVRLDGCEVDWRRRFKIVSKVQVDDAGNRLNHSILDPRVVLFHLGPEQHEYPYVPYECEEGTLWGVSVYTVEQATQALDRGAQALQVPWSFWTHAEPSGRPAYPWEKIRDRAYADGVLFFGRQPFARGAMVTRGALEWALQSNPRGWCVVGAETAEQVEELCRWREELG